MDQRRKHCFKSYGSSKTSRSGSFAQHQEPVVADRNQDDGDRREVVVKIDGSVHGSFAVHGADGYVNVCGHSSNNCSTVNTPRAAGVVCGAWGSGSGSSVTTSPRALGNACREGGPELSKEGPGARSGESFSFNSRPPSSPALNTVVACGDDPPARLIGSFLRRQAAAGGEVSLDPELEMEDLKRTLQTRTPASMSASRELRVSFQDPHKRLLPSTPSSSSPSSDAVDRRKQAPSAVDTAEVIRCTSTSTGPGQLPRSKTRSRLMDPPPPFGPPGADGERKSCVMRGPAKSGQLFSGLIAKSGLIGKSGPIGKSGLFVDDDEDDPFMDEVIPSDFNRGRLDCLTILEWVSLVVIVVALVCSLTIHTLSRKKLSGLHLWKWEVLVLVIICGRLVSGWVIRIAVFFIERNFLPRKRVLYFVYGVRRPVRNSLWLGLALGTWLLLFDNDTKRETHAPVLPYVTKVLCCLLVATVSRLVKTLLLKVLASSFHVSTYFDRIQEALFNQYVIETLSGPPLVDDCRMLAEVHRLQSAGASIPNELQGAAMPSKSGLVPKSGRLSGPTFRRGASKQPQKERVERDEGITIDHLNRLSQKNISAWNMKRLMKIVRYGALTTMDEQIKQATGKEDELATQIHSEYEAKIAAKRIFHNVAKLGSKYIYLSDLMRFMRQEEAIKAMNLFEGAQEHSRVSKRPLKNWVVNAFRERKALALTLNDTKTAVNKLHQMANIVVGIIVFALWLLILGIATTRFFVFLSSQLLVAVFMFGNTLKTIFEAMVFLFVMHPFDVGDRCEVDGVQLVVEEMNILTTIFLRYDNLKVYYPNSVLATLPIMNYYRSPDMGDAIDFTINVSTPVEKLALMKERLLHYLDNKKEHWYPGSMVVLREVDDTNKLRASIWFRHTINYQDMGMRYERRELVLQEMIKILKDLDIEYQMLPLDVNVRNAPSIQTTRLPTTWMCYS